MGLLVKIPQLKKTIAKQAKQVSKSSIASDFETNFEANTNSKDKSTNKNNKNVEVALLDKKDEVAPTDEIKNARKKRRRSSASIE